jgi:hypothetical protein
LFVRARLALAVVTSPAPPLQQRQRYERKVWDQFPGAPPPHVPAPVTSKRTARRALLRAEPTLSLSLLVPILIWLPAPARSSLGAAGECRVWRRPPANLDLELEVPLPHSAADSSPVLVLFILFNYSMGNWEVARLAFCAAVV